MDTKNHAHRDSQKKGDFFGSHVRYLLEEEWSSERTLKCQGSRIMILPCLHAAPIVVKRKYSCKKKRVRRSASPSPHPLPRGEGEGKAERETMTELCWEKGKEREYISRKARS
jgi:hypothetical protein